MKFDIFGPFQVPRQNNGLLTRDARARRDFWLEIDEQEEGLSGAVGCYVISVRNVVHYIGLAERQAFCNECFSPHKVTKFDDAISEGRGNAMLHLVAKRTEGQRFARPSPNGHKDIQKIEDFFIAYGLERNDGLLNKRDTAILREIKVPGFFNTGQGEGRAHAVQSLVRIMGFRS